MSDTHQPEEKHEHETLVERIEEAAEKVEAAAEHLVEAAEEMVEGHKADDAEQDDAEKQA